MDKEDKWINININIDGEDNRTIGYNCNSLEDPTSDSDGSFEDNLINA